MEWRANRGCALEGDKMIIIYDTLNNKVIDNMGTNQNFPDGNIENLPVLPENQVYIRIHDDSDDARTIQSAKEYNLTVENGNLLSVNVIKTHKQEREEKEATEQYQSKKLLNDTKDEFISKLEELVIELAKTPENNVSEELRTLAEQRREARSKS